jgi:SAM-dependent methyltransferase
MKAHFQSLAQTYDEKYRCGSYFRYNRWLFRSFIKALATKARLKDASRILDAGCGQGFFSGLFAELGFKPLGVDISGEAVRTAEREYGSKGATFEVGDVTSLPFFKTFDCVFVRGCSLYNSQSFQRDRTTTDILLKYVRSGGFLIFDYYTKINPRRKSATWTYHSIAETKQHFSVYPGAQVYFSLRFDALLLRRLAFTRVSTVLNAFVSRITGIGGDLVVLIPNDRQRGQEHFPAL